jgi:hypothetical protein
MLLGLSGRQLLASLIPINRGQRAASDMFSGFPMLIVPADHVFDVRPLADGRSDQEPLFPRTAVEVAIREPFRPPGGAQAAGESLPRRVTCGQQGRPWKFGVMV